MRNYSINSKKHVLKKLVNLTMITLLILATFSVYFVENVSASPDEPPYQSGETPINESTNVDPMPTLYVTCIDNDTGIDTMNATWWSNSSGDWVIFATNLTSFANETNISQINTNFSTEGTQYWWSVNLTDGINWTNDTYSFITNYAPYQNNEAPTSGMTNTSITPSLFVVCYDNDTEDALTANWYSNSSGSLQLFATNVSVSNGENITQTNYNFTQSDVIYYWSVYLTDDTNTTNMTYSLVVNYAPYPSDEAPTNTLTNITFNPTLAAVCTDNDTDALMAYWFSNSSGSWVPFDFDDSFNSGTNITATNNNFSTCDTTYYWSINITDTKSWNNITYYFTTNNAPYSINEAPTSGSYNGSLDPNLYVVCNDNNSDVLAAQWYSNWSGPWTLFGENSSFNPGTNITQQNTNFTQPNTMYYWSINITDGKNWTNNTYSFLTNGAPLFSNEAPPSGSTGVVFGSSLYVICTDNDNDVMSAEWWSNTSGSWVLFATNESIISGTNITQNNANFTNEGNIYYWSINITDGQSWGNSTYSFRTNYVPNSGNENPLNYAFDVPTNYPFSVQCNDSDYETLNAYWHSNSSGDWVLFGENLSIPASSFIIQYNSNFSDSSTQYWWSINITDGKNWSNTTYTFTTSNQGGGTPPFYINEWYSSVSPTYITNTTSSMFNFSLPRDNGWDQLGMRLNNLTITLPDDYTYVGNNGTTLGSGSSTEYNVTNTASTIQWTKSNSEGFLYNSSEYFWFDVTATGSLGSSTFNITAEYNNSNTQNITLTVFITRNFTFNGSIFDINGNAIEGGLGRLSAVSFSNNGPPVNLGLFTGTSNSTGNFTILGVPTTVEPDAQPGPGGGSDLFYRLSAIQLEEGTPYALNISASLPTIPYFELGQMLNEPEMYLKQAMTFEIDVIGPSWNWSTASIDGYSQKSFQVQAKDLTMGYPIQENNTAANGQLFSVPAERNYSLSIFPDMSFPVSVQLNNILSTCQASGDLNQTGVVVNYNGFNGSYLVNISVNASYTHQYLNGTFSGVSEISEMRVIAYNMESDNMVFENWALPFNLANETGQPDDIYNFSSGVYNISLPASEASSYIMLRAYARNQSGIDYMDSYIINTSGGTLNVSYYNFTMLPMMTGSGLTNRSITSNNVTNQWGEEIVMNTTGMTFNLVNDTGSLLSSDSSFIEIKRELNGAEYMQMVNAQNGQFNISLQQGESIRKLTIYSQQYAPLTTRINSSVLSGVYNTSSINCSNGVCNITLRSFGEFDPLNKSGSMDMYMSIFKSNSSCNVADPPDYCDLCQQEGEVDKNSFSPFNAILKGDVNMMIKSYVADGKIIVYYINVDLLASGPPDAAYTDSATESSGGLEAAWQFGSQGPDIYDYVIIGVPYSSDMDEREIVVKITKLYDNEFNVIWDTIAGSTIDDINNDDNLSDYRDYLNSPYEAYLNGTGVVCNESDSYFESGLGYKDIANQLIWIKIPHFSGLGPVIYYSGGNQSYQLNESPTDGITNICPIPSLHVLCIDNDTEDTMNATWYSNSTDGNTWVEFGSNTSIENNTNITQTNTNFSTPGTSYWWRVNLTDGTNWYNMTYKFTTNNEPALSGGSPSNGLTDICPTPSLYVICSDTDDDSNTADWYSNSSGSWVLFATSEGITNGENITQTNDNFSGFGTTYYWSVNLTDGCNWTNSTYSFTTNALPSVSSVSPANWANDTQLYTPCSLIVTDTDGDTLTVYFREQNSTDVWLTNQTNSSVASGSTVVWLNYTNSSIYSTVYNWSVNVTDGCNWTNATYNFTTITQYNPNAPSSFTASSGGSTSISLSWTKGNKADYTRIQRKTGSYPTNISDGTDVYNDTGSSKTDSSGLAASTTYYYRAWSWNSTGGEWGITNVTSYTTTDAETGSGSGAIPNIAPTAEAGGPYTGVINAQVTFTGSGTDTDGTIAGYRWDFNNDGTYDTDWSTGTSASTSYSSIGTYTVKLQVKDNYGSTGIDTATVTITIAPPEQNPPTISSVYIEPSSPVSDYSVTVYATIIDDTSVSSATVYWNDGTQHSKAMTKQSTSDIYSANIGQFASGKTVTYYIIALDAVSNSKQSDSQSFTVGGPEPTITIANPKSGSVIYNTKPFIKATYSDILEINTNSVKITLDGSDITSKATVSSSSVQYTTTTNMTFTAHTVSVTVSDTGGSNATKSWSFTIAESESSSSQDTGNVSSNETKEIEFDEDTSKDTGIGGLSVISKNNLENTNLFIAKLKTKPEDVSEPDTNDLTIDDIEEVYIYSYVEIEFTVNGSDLEEGDVNSITIDFKIEKAWIEENDVDIDTVRLLRNVNGEWQELTTTFVGEDEIYAYFQTTTIGLSTFAVVGSKVVVRDETLTPEQGLFSWVLIIGAIIAGIIIVIIILFKTGILYVEQEEHIIKEEEKPKQKKRKKK